MASDEDPAHTEAPAAGNFWERLPSTTGLVRWAAALGLAENAAKIRTLSYPDHVPVLQFLSRETISQQPEWLGSHERQLENVKRRELVVLDGNHYLHWTQSQAMATKIAEFLSPAGTVP
ncbi:hypothetical protein PV761_15955 [Arthrobacter sp. CC3]|uniref:hypothetical protein n=1 Tax=Arthrobacter sp. CC3 TaxID=3029185 RepID=UPI003264B313